MITNYKPGDRVVVSHESDYNKMLVKHGIGESYIGKTGTVVETRYNRNMAGYGRGNEVLVRLDDFDKNTKWVFCDTDLETITQWK